MRTKRITFGFLVLSLLACNFVNQMITPPTATPQPTLTATASLTPTPEPLRPAYIPPECAAVPLATVSPDVALAQPALETQTNPQISKNEQLNVFNDITETVRDVYIYRDYNGKDWSKMQARYKDKINAGLDTESFYLEMGFMIFELGDEHSFYLSPLEVEQSETELRGDNEVVGIGVLAEPDFDRGRIMVFSTFAGSVAEHGGIQPHDAILLVDGLPIRVETGNRLRGPECSAVILTVQSPGEASRDVMLIRQTFQGGLEIDARIVLTTDGSRIGYIFIPTFFDETIPPQIVTALQGFGELDGLILDVRLNGGGSSMVVDPIFAYFVSGRLGRFVSRDESHVLNVEADPIGNSQSVPLVVVVSEGTASYGEIFAGVLKDLGRAKITGETSLGNVEVLHGFNFDDGSQLWIAAATFRPENSDQDWEKTGIIPDLPAFALWDTFTFETDPSIAAALTLLGHK